MAGGGYDNDFFESVLDRYICHICTKPLRDPHLVVCCGQHYCESCLNQWIEQQYTNSSCPHCRAVGGEFQHVVDRKLKHKIKSFQVKCTNYKEGCEWTGELGAEKKHLESADGCGYVDVECSNGCVDNTSLPPKVLKIKRKDLRTHLQEECVNRPYQCRYCRKPSTYSEIVNNHYKSCPKFPLDCPYKCSAKLILRIDMRNHCLKCPQQPVECPFTEAGCTMKLVRQDLEKHTSTMVHQHLMMVMTAFRWITIGNQYMENELKEIKTKLEDIKLQTTQVKSEITHIKQSLSQYKKRYAVNYMDQQKHSYLSKHEVGVQHTPIQRPLSCTITTRQWRWRAHKMADSVMDLDECSMDYHTYLTQSKLRRRRHWSQGTIGSDSDLNDEAVDHGYKEYYEVHYRIKRRSKQKMKKYSLS